MTRLPSVKTLYGFLIIITVVVITVYITGIPLHRSIQNNALISWSIISMSFFVFLFIGFYLGIKIKNTIVQNKSTLNIADSPLQIQNLPSRFDFLPEIEIASGGLEEMLISILWWIAVLIVGVILLLLFEAVIWFGTILMISFFHWIFYRAINVALSNSSGTKGNFKKSLSYSIYYALIYTGWLFVLIYIFNFFN